VGILASATDAPLWIADALGYFREEGLVVQFVDFSSGEAMVAPLSTGQLDVGGGSPAASLYNAVARGVGVRLVANLGTDAPGYGFEQMLVRSELVRSGRYKTPKDVKGLSLATNAHGSPSSPQVSRFLAKYGLTDADVKHVYLSYPNHVVALTNGSVDVTSTIEPFASRAIRSGVAVKIEGNDAFYPNQELSCLMYGSDFIGKRHDVALKFMRAFIRGARYYDDALANGKLAGKNADEVVALLAKMSPIKDPATLRAITPTAIDPNGALNVASLREDLAWFRKEGLIEGNVTAERVVDTSFARDAVRALGTSRAAKR
jgi:NitT/TauT family transport system substrate-binding protein